MSDLTVAVAGLGAFGRRYVDGLAWMRGVRVKWGVDLDADRRESAVADGVVDGTTAEMDDVLADDAVDAVFALTPEDAHRAIAVGALEAGKHVVVEKPLAETVEDAVAIADTATRTGRMLLPAFLLRFDYRYAAIKERLDTYGEVRSIYAWRNFDRKLFEVYARAHSFIENAIHDIDVMLWYLGRSVSAVHGFTRNTIGLQHPDVNWGVLEFEGGTIGVLQTTWLYPPPKSGVLEQANAGIHVMTDHGVLEASYDQRSLMTNSDDEGIMLLDLSAWGDVHGEPRGAFGAQLRHLVATLRGEREWVGSTPAEAVESLRIARLLVDDANHRAEN